MSTQGNSGGTSGTQQSSEVVRGAPVKTLGRVNHPIVFEEFEKEHSVRTASGAGRGEREWRERFRLRS